MRNSADGEEGGGPRGRSEGSVATDLQVPADSEADEDGYGRCDPAPVQIPAGQFRVSAPEPRWRRAGGGEGGRQPRAPGPPWRRRCSSQDHDDAVEGMGALQEAV